MHLLNLSFSENGRVTFHVEHEFEVSLTIFVFMSIFCVLKEKL